MISEEQLSTVRGATVYDADGDKVGKAGDVYLDDATGRPEWLTVNTGLFGSHESFIPLEQVTLSGDEVRVPFDKAKIKDAPRVAADGHLDPSEEEQLYRYYGIATSGQTGTGIGADTGTGMGTDTGRTTRDDQTLAAAGLAGTGTSGTTGTAGGLAGGVDRDRDGNGVHDDVEGRAVGRDTSGPTTDDAMTRSEEELRVGTQTREAGRARLRKYVVTERQTVTVPVSHEEVRLEREPITEANRGAAYDGPAISEEEHEVVLHEEVPVVAKEAHPVERVRVDTRTVTEQQEVSADVRKEQIELETEGTTGTSGTTGTRGVDPQR